MSVGELRKKYVGVADHYLQFIDVYRDFVDREIMPRRRDLDGGKFRKDEELALRTFEELHKGLIELGVQRGFFPTEVGGMGMPLSFELAVPTIEELARGDNGLAMHLLIPMWAFMAAIFAPNERVLRDFGPIICGSELSCACLAMTEPAGGCNLEDPSQCGRTIQTTARLDGDSWVINGQKLWPSASGIANVYMTVCTTDASKGDEGIALIYVPREAPGLTFGPREAKMGMIYTDYNGAVYYDDVRVPKEYRASGPGRDAELFHEALAMGRIGSAALALGPAQATLEIVIEYAKDRYIVGKQVRERSMHAGIIADMAIAVEASRAYYIQVTKMFDQSEIFGKWGEPYLHGKASGAKVLASDTAVMVTNRAMELMGSMGYCEDMHVEKYLRDGKVIQLVEGGGQLGRLDMARSLYPVQW